jgi:ornithine cyclodeaminase/alanine dehydrogenase-like protein (mu-crystallin family)
MTTLRAIGAEDISRTLPFGVAADVLAAAFTNSESDPLSPRQALPFADGELLVMSAVRNGGIGASYAGVKMVTVRNANRVLGLPSVHAAYILFGGESLVPLALIDGAALTGFRTAAVSALATRILAPRDATRLVIFGAGVQAQYHLKAMAAVRPVGQVTIVNRDAERAAQLIEMARVLGLDACRGGAESVAEADIVCTCTTSFIPVFDGSLLSAGAHVNAIGSYHSDARELDDHTAARGRWFVEDRASAFEEAGDVLMPIARGAVGVDFVLDDLFGLCAGAVGRTSADEITVFKSVGLAIEDLAIAEALLGYGPNAPNVSRPRGGRRDRQEP